MRPEDISTFEPMHYFKAGYALYSDNVKNAGGTGKKMETKGILRIVLSIALVAAIFYLGNAKEIMTKIFSFDIIYLPIIAALLAAIFLLNALNLKSLLDIKEKIGYFEVLRVFLYSWSLSFIGFGRAGEFAFIPGIANKSSISIGKASAIFVINKAINLFAITLTAIFCVVIFFEQYLVPVAAASALIWIFIGATISPPARSLLKIILGKRAEIFSSFSSTLKEYIQSHKTALFRNFVTYEAILLVQAAYYFAVSNAIGAKPDFAALFSLLTISSILTAIPISVIGIGAREGFFVAAASHIGISSGIAAAIVALTASVESLFFICFVLAEILMKNLKK